MINFTVSDTAIVAVCALVAVVVICRTVIHLRRSDNGQTFWSDLDE